MSHDPHIPAARSRRASLARVAVVCIVIGLLINVAVSFALAAWVDPLSGDLSSMVAEIDAVGLVDRAGKVQWAVKSRASSFYGQGSFATPAARGAGPLPADLLPNFGDLKPVSVAIENGTANLERRAIAGYGWPMRALWTPLDPAVGTPTNQRAAMTFVVTPPATVRPAKDTLPLRSAWGLAVNTLLFAAVAGVLYWLLVMPRRFITEVVRIRRGARVVCGYDLGYDFIQGCPECGWRRKRE